MKLPWFLKGEEHRAYTEAYIEAAFAAASGEVVAGMLASLEVVAGWWQRAFQAVDVQPAGVVADLLGPHMGAIGRGLVTRGEIVFAIDTDGDSMALLPASECDVYGGPNPSSWAYRLTLTGPTETITRTLSSDRVLHLMYAPSTHSWRGVSPLLESSTTRTLLSNMETRLSEETGMGVGAVIPVPNVTAVTKLQAQLRALGGKLALVQTTNKGYGEGQSGVPSGDFTSKRIGGTPPEATVSLRRQAEESILAAAGVPVAALGGDSDSAVKEGLRIFVFTVISPVAARLAEVVGMKFGMPDLTFGLEGLRATDIQARSRAFGTMVQAGMSVQEAGRIAMLLEA